jgi:hypothetical protein
MRRRSTAATHAAHSSRVHWSGSWTSGCSAASHRPIRNIWLRLLFLPEAGSVEVSCHRCTQSAHVGATPSTGGGTSLAGGRGALVCPRAASARWRLWTFWRSEYGIDMFARNP